MAKRTYHPWAVGITIVIVVFLIVSIGLTIIISQEDYHLVTDDYYEKDLRFQEKMETRKRTKELDIKPVISIDREAKTCILSFPPRESYDGIAGSVEFFRISDATRDVTRPLQLNSEGRQVLSVSGLHSGQWIVKLTWTESGTEYYLEERIYLQ
ncbi:MAG TPA: FixH family protein [Bacteroidota bacterium]|nr:FixH family protein [Bacteroidota bacterium]